MRSIHRVAVVLCAAATTSAFAQGSAGYPFVTGGGPLYPQPQLQQALAQYELMLTQLAALQAQLAATQPAPWQSTPSAAPSQGCANQPIAKE